MELKEFISSTIEQISQGLIDAQVKCRSIGVIVNPDITIGQDGDFSIPKQPEHVNIVRRVQILNMDAGVTIAQGEDSKAGGKIGVSFANIGANLETNKASTNVNRVQFSIPVAFPTTTVLTSP